MKTIIFFITFLFFAFLIGCSDVTNKHEPPSESSQVNSASSEEEHNVTGINPKDEVKTGELNTAINERSSREHLDGKVVGACSNTDYDWLENIRQSAVELSGTEYVYGKTDCSGMFHMVVDRLRNECPNAIFPTKANAKSSRFIAVWYEKHGDLTIIRNPANDGHLIKPGMVMFFGYTNHASKYNYQSMTIDTLKAKNTGINHVAIVTDVKLDANGKVVSYDMFHGLNKNKVAQVTTSYRESNYPVYGNWGEPWLAVAEVMATKN